MENEKGEIVDLYVDIFISVFLLGLEIFFFFFFVTVPCGCGREAWMKATLRIIPGASQDLSVRGCLGGEVHVMSNNRGHLR